MPGIGFSMVAVTFFLPDVESLLSEVADVATSTAPEKRNDLLVIIVNRVG